MTKRATWEAGHVSGDVDVQAHLDLLADMVVDQHERFVGRNRVLAHRFLLFVGGS